MNRWGALCIALVGLCAIDWYRPDGSQLNQGDFIYTRDQAVMMGDSQLGTHPGYTYQIRCVDS